MKKLEILSIKCEESGEDINVVRVDGEIFDWGMDPESLDDARKTILHNKELTESIILSVVSHFFDCLSDFLGQKIDLEKFLVAIKRGYIE